MTMTRHQTVQTRENFSLLGGIIRVYPISFQIEENILSFCSADNRFYFLFATYLILLIT